MKYPMLFFILCLPLITFSVRADNSRGSSSRAGALVDEHLRRLQGEDNNPAPILNIDNLYVETLCAGIVGENSRAGRLIQRVDGNIIIQCK